MYVLGANGSVEEFIPTAFGWINDQQAVNSTAAAMEIRRNLPVQFSQLAPQLMDDPVAADDSPVFLHQAEYDIVGLWFNPNQSTAGTCVGFGMTGAAQDTYLQELAMPGSTERWTGELAIEPTYAGSRVEVGGNRIRGDGSIGAWAAQFLTRGWGIITRGVYGPYDLSRYSIELCRSWGGRPEGLPKEIEDAARLHPISDAALISTGDELWAALGAGKGVGVCSNQGFDSPLDEHGFCEPRGMWPHCMRFRARFRHPRYGRSVLVGNSWDDYLRAGKRMVSYLAADGSVRQFTMPPGHFCIPLSTASGMCAQRDTWGLAGVSGWNRTVIDNSPL